MKMMRNLFIVILLATSQAACSISREDVLECGLSDGSKFVLRAKYDWYPVAKLIPADVAERLNQEPYDVEFVNKNGKTSGRAPAAIDHSNFEMSSLERACSKMGLLHERSIVARTFLRDDGTWFPLELFPQKLYLSAARSEQPEKIRNELKKMNGIPTSHAFVYPERGRLVYEHPIEQFGASFKVIAVYKSISTDMGKTWSDPVITTDAEIFELGKTILEQSFIARPISINGKKLKAEFPPQRKP
jgi:hypothetical protein